MTEAVTGHDTGDARALAGSMRAWFASGAGADSEPPVGLDALSAVRAYPARRRCVLLSWEALADALDTL